MKSDELYRFVSEDLARELREARERNDKLHRRAQAAEAANATARSMGAASRNLQVAKLKERISDLEGRLNAANLRLLNLSGAVTNPYYQPHPEQSGSLVKRERA